MIGNIGGSFGMSSMISQNKPTASQVFSKADADNSGGLTLAEFAPGQKTQNTAAINPVQKIMPSAQEAFDMLDVDGNGEISLEEFEQGQPVKKGPPPNISVSYESTTITSILSLQEISISGDASSIEDIIAKLMENVKETNKHSQAFNSGDEDGDGSLSSEEFASLHESKHGANAKRSAEEVFSKLDTDGNGEISEEEFLNGPHAKKGKGKNSNPLLSLQELEISMSTTLIQSTTTQANVSYASTQSFLEQLISA